MENQDVINSYRLQSGAQSSQVQRKYTTPSSDSSRSEFLSIFNSESEKEEPFRFVTLFLAFVTGIFISNPFLGTTVRNALFETIYPTNSAQMYQIWEAIAYLASVIYAFLIYWLIRQKPLEYIFVLAALLSALAHFFYQYSFRVPLLVFLCALLMPFSWTFYAILPQRIATVWFYPKRRLQICAFLYLTISIGAEINVLRALGSLGKGSEFQSNFKEYSIAKGVIILSLAVILYSFLRPPPTFPNAMGSHPIQSFKEGLRLTLCNPNIYEFSENAHNFQRAS